MIFKRRGCRGRRHRTVGLATLGIVLLAACNTTDPTAEPESADVAVLSDTAASTAEPAFTPTPTDPPVPGATDRVQATTTSLAPTTTPTVAATTTTTTSTTTTTTTTTSLPPSQPGPTGMIDTSLPTQTIGLSKQGRPIVAERFGTDGGRRVLVIGVIHGNEDAGIAIVRELRNRQIPDGIELWLIESMNPDGQFAQRRQNASGVDLNRNFPYEWGPIGNLGDSQYAGPSAASEPETQTMVAFIEALRPDIAIWYHQDANLVIPSTGRDGRIRVRYAELTGLPIADCCDGGGVYTGIAATWARVELKRDSDAVPFIVELPGGDLDATQIDQHANAVLTIAAEG